VRWSPAGNMMYFNFAFGAGRACKAVAVPILPGRLFSALPPDGLTLQELVNLPGAKRLDSFVRPSPLAGVLAYQKQMVQRNIYRIPLR
jgi:hypothetical protein